MDILPASFFCMAGTPELINLAARPARVYLKQASLIMNGLTKPEKRKSAVWIHEPAMA